MTVLPRSSSFVGDNLKCGWMDSVRYTLDCATILPLRIILRSSSSSRIHTTTTTTTCRTFLLLVLLFLLLLLFSVYHIIPSQSQRWPLQQHHRTARYYNVRTGIYSVVTTLDRIYFASQSITSHHITSTRYKTKRTLSYDCIP